MEAQFIKRFYYCLILLSWVSISFSQVPEDMVTIGAGSYVPLYGTTDKKPVNIKSFLLDVYPVTNQQYLEFLKKIQITENQKSNAFLLIQLIYQNGVVI